MPLICWVHRASLFPTAAANQRRSPHARGQHAHSACARDTRRRDCNGRPDDMNALAASPGSSAVASVWCGKGRMHAVLFSGVSARFASQSRERAPACVLLSDVRFASRTLGCPSRVPPCANRMLRGEGVCAQTALRVCSPCYMIPRFYPTLSLIPTQSSTASYTRSRL